MTDRPPSPDWTMDQMLATAKKLTRDDNGDGHPEQFGISFQDFFLFWFPYVWSYGGDLLSADHSDFTLDSPEAVQGLQFYADLRNKHHVAPTAAESGATKMSQMFMNGKLAMVVNGRWAVPLYRQNLKFGWDIVASPKGPKGSVVDADASRRCLGRTHRRRRGVRARLPLRPFAARGAASRVRRADPARVGSSA